MRGRGTERVSASPVQVSAEIRARSDLVLVVYNSTRPRIRAFENEAAELFTFAVTSDEIADVLACCFVAADDAFVDERLDLVRSETFIVVTDLSAHGDGNLCHRHFIACSSVRVGQLRRRATIPDFATRWWLRTASHHQMSTN